MPERAHIRINLAQREIEISGDEAFVERHAERIETMFELLLADPEPMPVSPAPPQPTASKPAVELGSFGEYLIRLPNSATEVDKMLAAGFYCESASPEASFSTGDANRRLVEQGIKVGNASQCVKQSLTAKRLFVYAKGQYKVSQEGRRYLQRLMGEI